MGKVVVYSNKAVNVYESVITIPAHENIVFSILQLEDSTVISSSHDLSIKFFLELMTRSRYGRAIRLIVVSL